MKKIFTIPNIISLFRLILIPFFVFFYFKDNVENHFFWAIFIVVLSGFSDVVDGFIARNFNMVSDFGKILDPIADKMTQAVVLLSLAIKHTALIPMFAVLFLKELLTMFAAIQLLSNGTKPISSKWWGKLTTVVIFITTIYTVVMDIYSVPVYVLYGLIILSIGCMVLSMGNYGKMFFGQAKGEKTK